MTGRLGRGLTLRCKGKGREGSIGAGLNGRDTAADADEDVGRAAKDARARVREYVEGRRPILMRREPPQRRNSKEVLLEIRVSLLLQPLQMGAAFSAAAWFACELGMRAHTAILLLLRARARRWTRESRVVRREVWRML